MLFNVLKSPKDRFAIASEASGPTSLAREMDIRGIPFDFCATNFAFAIPGTEWTVSKAADKFLSHSF